MGGMTMKLVKEALHEARQEAIAASVAPANAVQDATDKPQPQPAWTVMIFMGVKTLKGAQSLEQAFVDDIKEIARVGGGGAHKLQIFVQAHRGEAEDVVRIHFGEGAPQTEDGGVDARRYRDGHALGDFITYALTAAENIRPTDYTMLVLWGHAYDFTFGQLETPEGLVTALNFVDIRDVLRKVQARVVEAMPERAGGKEWTKLDVVGFDACDIATAEIAYQLRPVADFLLASQIGIPVPGWPYHRILDRLKEPKGPQIMSPAELGSYAVRRFCAAYDYSTPVSLTMLNLHHAEALYEKTEDVAVELATAIENPQTRYRIARTFFRSQTEFGKPFVDIADLCMSLLSEREHPGLADKARALGDLVAGSRESVEASYHQPGGWPLVVDHDRNAGELVRLNGVSLYAPNVAPPGDFDEVASRYRRLEFVSKGRWSGVVHKLSNGEA